MSVIAPVRPEMADPKLPPSRPFARFVRDEYKEAVTNLALSKVNRRLLNDSCEHAKLLADLMIGRTREQDQVCIYSGELGSGCYLDALNSSKAREIRILLDVETGKGVIDGLPSDVKSRIKAKVLTGKGGNHFFIAGDAFRFELNHDDATAIANFNEPQTTAALTVRFNRLWDSISDA